MRELARQGSQDLRVRAEALRCVENIAPKDTQGEVESIYDFVRTRIRYVHDIKDVETLHYAATLLDVGQGDCDDMAILLAAMLMSIGHKCQFVAVSFAPEKWSHVWTRAFVKGQWLDLEPTEPLPFGERIPLNGGARLLTLDT